MARRVFLTRLPQGRRLFFARFAQLGPHTPPPGWVPGLAISASIRQSGDKPGGSHLCSIAYMRSLHHPSSRCIGQGIEFFCRIISPFIQAVETNRNCRFRQALLFNTMDTRLHENPDLWAILCGIRNKKSLSWNGSIGDLPLWVKIKLPRTVIQRLKADLDGWKVLNVP